MDDLLHIGVNYWPHLLGIVALVVALVNVRSWFNERRKQV
jgi:hypothetical protein